MATKRDDIEAPRSRIDGIGRPRIEQSLVPNLINDMIRASDVASIATTYVLSNQLFRRVGGSTGTNFFALCCVAAGMMHDGTAGTLVTLICGRGDRYAENYFNPDWLAREIFDIALGRRAIKTFLDHGGIPFPHAYHACDVQVDFGVGGRGAWLT